MIGKKLIPITAKDFYLLDKLCKEQFGEPLGIAKFDIVTIGNRDTNPKCGNCGMHFNGHFIIKETYCPGCGCLIGQKPKPIIDPLVEVGGMQ